MSTYKSTERQSFSARVRWAAMLAASAWTAVPAIAAVAQTPLTSNPTVATANGPLTLGPGESVIFDTDYTSPDAGQYSLTGGASWLGTPELVNLAGRSDPVNSSQPNGYSTSQTYAFDFTGITIPASATVQVEGSLGLTLLTTGNASVGAAIDFSGGGGQTASAGNGGGGGGGGGVFSMFANGTVNFGGSLNVNGGSGGLSFQTAGATSGGAGGAAGPGGGLGGVGGGAPAGGGGGTGGNGALVGIKGVGLYLDGGGGGGGGGYNGPAGGPGRSNSVNNAAPGAPGTCPNPANGGDGGGVAGAFASGVGGAGGVAPAGPGGNGPGSGFYGGCGGGGGAASSGSPGGPGGSGGPAAGGGGGGGGGDKCVGPTGTPGTIGNGGDGGGGGGAGSPGSAILSAANLGGGGAGAGQVFLGTNDVASGALTYNGSVTAVGGTGMEDGGNGLLTLIGASPNVTGGTFDGLLLSTSPAGVTLESSLSNSAYEPLGGAGGGGAGGAGQYDIPEPGTGSLLIGGAAILMRRRKSDRGVI